MAEAHPVGFRWVIKARERGALVIHVDPRFSRTSAQADLWAPIRAGSDIAFFGGLINYVLAHDRVFRDYVVAYTNAAILVREDFAGPEDLEWPVLRLARRTRARTTRRPGSTTSDDDGTPRRDPTLEHPRTIYQQLVRHFARYTPEMVERVCGIPRETFLDDRRPVHVLLGSGSHGDDLLRRRTDAAFGRRADRAIGGDSSVAARQHRPAGRRHPRAARPRLHSGIDRHPDAVRSVARLPADAGVRPGDGDARALHRRGIANPPACGPTSTRTSSAC